jgi:hypothetical protein
MGDNDFFGLSKDVDQHGRRILISDFAATQEVGV